jgi:ethanolamine ammonia-lyase small subunit
MTAPSNQNSPWLALRQLTTARLALGHTGVSLPSSVQLDFQLAHAQARDAVHLPFNHQHLAHQLTAMNQASLVLHSAASSRLQYLQRPDLGRQLGTDSAQRLDEFALSLVQKPELCIVIADGLSALAVHRHALPFLQAFEPYLKEVSWSIAPIVLVQQGRVAIADDIGERLGARMSLILIGERPGLSSPDSLGVYYTFQPKVGRNDAQRNCVSNIRLEGLSYDTAAHRLMGLMRASCARNLSGVLLKDEANDTDACALTETPLFSLT